jgi:LysR family glycine cleavage system transcriptional activator
MARIGEATRGLMGPIERDSVALTLPPSLAILWLIPNLASFERSCPGIDLQLVTTTRLCDLRREQIDLAVRYGRGPWSDVETEFLLSETAMPVCRPDFLAAEATRDIGAVLASCRLIINGYHPDEWHEWARAHGAEPPELADTLRLETQDQVLAAAERGLGLAIGRRPLVDERLKSGALTAPFGIIDASETSYHLCWPQGATPSAGARRVGRWLRDFANQESARSDGPAA